MQYLTTTQEPVLEYRFDGDSLAYRWTSCVDGFEMPVKVSTSGREFLITAGTHWKKMRCVGRQLSVDRNFYVLAREVKK